MMFMFQAAPLVAIIGDIKRSKQLAHRGDTQRKLIQTLDGVNRAYAGEIASRFMVTLGDEFQGLLRRGAQALRIVDQIERDMYPVRLRFGIGAGAITTDINAAVPLGADGPAYYLAREAITEVKACESRKQAPTRSLYLKTEGNEALCGLINAAFSLLTSIKDTWTPRQAAIISAYIQNGGTQTDAARKLGVTPSNVQKTLRAANYYTYRSAVESISAALAEIRGA